MSTIHGKKPQLLFGMMAVTGTLAVVQIAGAATGATLADRFHAIGEPSDLHSINRAAKRDRDVTPPRDEVQQRTVLLKLEGLGATSVLLRIPAGKQARNNAPSLGRSPADGRKMAVACEPPVSVLTEVAKLLQPGRCVT